MYTSFRIQNFKGFRDLAFKEGDLARINLLAGKNNTGKTSVLEAIALHGGQHQELVNSVLTQRVRGSMSFALSLDTLFFDFDLDQTIEFSGTTDTPVKPSLYRNGSEYLELTSWKTTIEMILDSESVRSINKVEPRYAVHSGDDFRHPEPSRALETKYHLQGEHKAIRYVVEYLHGGIGRDTTIPIHITPTMFLRATDPIDSPSDARNFSRLDKDGELDLVIESVKLVDDRIKSLRILDENGTYLIFADVGISKPLPVASMGEGIQKMISILMGIGISSDGVLLIDEIENGLHHSILDKVWAAIDRASQLFNVQVFATTHSYEVIAAAHKHFSTTNANGDGYPFRLHRLDRQDDNEITHVTYDERTLGASLEFNLEVR